MRVLVVTNMYPTKERPHFGIFVHEQVESLRKLGVEIDVLFINGKKSKLEYVRGFPRLWKQLRKQDYDLIHAHYVLAGAVARAQRAVPVVLTHHGPEVFMTWQAWVSKLITGLFESVIVVSREMKDRLGVEKAHVIPCGIDLQHFTTRDKDQCRRELGLPLDKKLVLWAGENERPEKRFELVQAAMDRLQPLRPNVDLVLLTGKSHDVVPAYMAACDALVLTSDAEGSPMVIKEAMACNLPIVSTAVGDVADVISGTSGCYITSQRPTEIAWKLGVALERARRTEGRERVAHLSLDVISHRVMDVYRQTIADSRRQRAAALAAAGEGPIAVSPKVCVLRQNYFPEEAHVRKNVDALADAGYTVDIICLRARGERARERHRTGTIHRLPLVRRRGGMVRYVFEYTAFFVMAALLLTARSLRGRYDIIEVYNLPDALVLAALPAKLLGSKVVFYMFELMPEQAADELGLPADHGLTRRLRWLECVAVRVADRVITVSPYDRDIVLQRDRPRHDPTVILNVPAERQFTALASAGPDARDGVFRVLTHGSILRRYGIQTLVRAVPYLAERIPTVEVCILGDGEYRHELEALARELGIEGRVHFPGWIAHENVPEEIARADVGVVPASVPWLLPNKLFEYVAMGKPVVAAASPSLRSVFSSDCIAYYWPNDERDLARRIIELHENQHEAERLAANALRAFDAYRWECSCEQYVALHDDLLGGGALSPGKEAA